MVDKELIIDLGNSKYAYLKKRDSLGLFSYSLVYTNGQKLDYGDPAEIFSAVTSGNEFRSFIESTINETHFNKQHYWFTMGFQPADFDNEEIKESEVRIHYAGVDNTISKKDFYMLCLLLCDAKLKIFNMDDFITNEELELIKSKLLHKIKAIS